MPVATIELPDGRIADIEIPEGMEGQELQVEVQSMYERGEFGDPSAQTGQGGQMPANQDDGFSFDPQQYRQQLRSDILGELPGRALDVVGEAAAGANRTLLWVPNTAVKAINMLPGVEIPTAENMPGFGGNFMEPGMARDMVRAGGEVALPGAMGLKAVQGRNVGSVGGAVSELLGLGRATPVPGSVQATQEVIERVPAGQRVAKLDTPPEEAFAGAVSPKDLAVRRGRGDVAAAGFKMDDMGRTVPDPVQQRAIKQGLDKGVVAQVASASPADKKKVGEMLDIVEAGMNNKTVGDFNLPRAVLGDSMQSRWSVIKDANQAAGKAVNRESKALKDIPFDGQGFTEGPITNFLRTLQDDLDVSFAEGLKPVFTRSVLRGSKGSQKAIRDILDDLKTTPADSMYDAHNLKKFLDTMVDTYGQSVATSPKKAVTKTVQNAIKALRHDVNEFVRSKSPAYADANKIYSETIDVLNDADRLVGRNNPVDPKSLARTARKAVSNYQTGDQVMKLINDMDDLAVKYGAELTDDVKTQVSLVQTIEKLFPSARPPASFSSEIEKAVGPMMNAATGNKAGLIGDGMRAIGKKLGKSDDARLQEMIKVLRELSSE